MVELRYPLNGLVGDYLRGLIGVGICAVILSTIGTDTPMAWFFAALTLLFLTYVVRTGLKQATRFQLDEAGLRAGPWPKRFVAWESLDSMSLRYYSVRRKRKDGWMTLTLKSGTASIEIESGLPEFLAIAARAAYAAKESHLSLDRITEENLTAIGVKVEP
jgi:hypothetical protein